MSQRETNAHLKDSTTVRPTSSGLINTLLLFLLAIQVLFSYLSLSLSSLFIFDHLPSAYLLAHNYKTSRGLLKFSFVFTFVCDQFPLIPINDSMLAGITVPLLYFLVQLLSSQSYFLLPLLLFLSPYFSSPVFLLPPVPQPPLLLTLALP